MEKKKSNKFIHHGRKIIYQYNGGVKRRMQLTLFKNQDAESVRLNDLLYRYCWGNNEKRITMKGRICKVLAWGKMNSCMIEFTDNKQREIVSRNSLRKAV